MRTLRVLYGHYQPGLSLWALLSVLAWGLSFSSPAVSNTVIKGKADLVVVQKAERRLFLYQKGELLKSYRIGLGKQPVGHKQREGDSRTPEGLYTLDWRNPNSKFYRSIHISYPNSADRKSAKEAGSSPGSLIMIHGQPTNWEERIRLTFASPDWTEGCIAVENQDMDEIWKLVRDGTPIRINP